MPDPQKPTLMLIDGHSLAFRAFYALPVDSFTTRDGQHTNAIHGFLSMLLLLLADHRPTHLGVAFDLSRQSFRTREYDQYKATRSETPPEFSGQIPLIREALELMNVTTITKEDYEADDILATLARRGEADGFDVFVVSGDRDTIQLVDDSVTLLYPNARGVSELKRYDRAAVLERYGVEPAMYPDIAALVGETSDNLSGVDKVGEKTAVKWVLQYGGLDGVIEHAAEIKGVVGQNLRDQLDRPIRNRKLNRLVTDLELEVAPGDLQRSTIDLERIRPLFDRLQFRTLMERITKVVQAESGGASGAAAASQPVRLEPELAAPKPVSLQGAELAEWLDTQSAQGTEPLGLRVEFGPAGLSGFGVSSATDSAFVAFAGGVAEPAFAEWLAGPAPKVLHAAKRQTKLLAEASIALGGIEFDTSLGAWLLRPGTKPADLAGQVYEFLGETLQESDPNQLVPEGEPLSPATEAWYALRIAEHLKPRLDAGSMRVLAELELPLVPVLARMELDGITADRATLARLNGSLSATAEGHARDAFAAIGHEVNLGSPKQLQQVLFEELAMPRTRSTKTGYSTDAASLADLQERLDEPHPFLVALQAHRDATKLKQIVETLERSSGPDDRIHTTYDQTGTSTGRISSNDPNLQNIPIRAEEGREIRTAFVHGPEYETLLTADYSQIEMRIMAHLSGDSGLIDAFQQGEDLHRFVGSRVFGVTPADVSPAMRNKVKAMSYGLAYGLSAFGLSKQLRIETSEAKQLMADYFSRFGAVRDYLRNVVEQARVDGYTETIYGRRRPFGDLNSPNRVLRENAERAALNAPIQGSAADIMKIAMLGIAQQLAADGMRSRMLLQVHDELVFEVAEGELEQLAQLVESRMRGAAELRVPLDVQVGTGPNWDAAAH